MKQSALSAVLALIQTHGPVSSNTLAELSGKWRTAINRALREAYEAKLIHIAGYEPPAEGGTTLVKLYALGNLPDAKEPKNCVRHTRFQDKRGGAEIEGRVAEHAPRRDPFTAQFFGEYRKGAA